MLKNPAKAPLLFRNEVRPYITMHPDRQEGTASTKARAIPVPLMGHPEAARYASASTIIARLMSIAAAKVPRMYPQEIFHGLMGVTMRSTSLPSERSVFMVCRAPMHEVREMIPISPARTHASMRLSTPGSPG